MSRGDIFKIFKPGTVLINKHFFNWFHIVLAENAEIDKMHETMPRIKRRVSNIKKMLIALECFMQFSKCKKRFNSHFV